MTGKEIEALTNAIRAIAHGGTGGPSGLEMLAMAVAGEGLSGSAASAIQSAGDDIGRGLHAVAEAINNLAAKLPPADGQPQ